jgi:putative aminopeptidase FrvX
MRGRAKGKGDGERRARALALLGAFSNADGIPGYEEEVVALFRKELRGAGELRTDGMGSILCEAPGKAERPRLMIDCHMDEVGLMVQSVTPRGFVRFVPVGGWWGHVLLAQRVRIGTAQGKVNGIISSTPPHFLEAEQRKKVLEPREMFIDVGARDREEAEEKMGVRPGCPIAPATAFAPMDVPDLVSGKGFDNRVGCALLAQLLQELAAAKGSHPNTVVGVGSAQEEVGLRGATASVASARPDLALVLEGTPADDTPGLDPDRAQGELRKGVQIRIADTSALSHRGLWRALENVARKERIPYQLAVRHSGGTDAGAIQKHGTGVPAVVMGVPVRYIHSHVSVLHLDDYLAALRLARAFIAHCDRALWESLR